jgi:hypothetical protein
VTRVLTAKDVEAAASGSDGHRQVVVGNGTLITPLARDRAAALGVALVAGNDSPAAPTPAAPVAGDGLAQLRAESLLRSVARQVLLREGLGLGGLEEVVAAVKARLTEPASACGCAGCQRCP